MLSRIAVFGVVFAALAAFLPEARLRAQQAPREYRQVGDEQVLPQQTTTLRGWHERVQRALWNQSGGFGGTYYDRGLLRRNTYPMDHEYRLDVYAIRPSLAEETRFIEAENGFRTSGGSIDYGRLAVESELKAAVDVTESFGLEVKVVQQEDQSAKRLFLVPAYTWAINDKHLVGLRHSIQSFKQDIDAEAFYRYRNPKQGIQAELSLARLDVFNELINDVLVPDPVHIDTVRVFEQAPWAVSGHVKAPIWGPFLGEIVGGVQRRSVARTYLQSDSSDAFEFTSTFRYLGMLLEAEVLPGHLNVGGELRGTRSSVSRHAEQNSPNPSDYAASQSSFLMGLFANGRWRNFSGEGQLAREVYEDAQWGRAFGGSIVDGPYRVGERWTWIKLRADAHLHKNRLGPYAGIEYNAGFRSFKEEDDEEEIQDSGVVRFRARGPNHRIALRLGYRISDRADVVLGVNYDVDGDSFLPGVRRFDGVWSRILVTW